MGPLKGYVVVELAGIGPGPMAGMMLADMGADVIRIERSAETRQYREKDISLRGKKSVLLDLKKPLDVERLLAMIEKADAVIDPYRPGVCEKLGIGPDVCLKRNPRLVFGRLTGWGQSGPLAKASGHDLNYIAITGALHSIGRKNERPVVPLNLIGDMGGGAMLLVTGILAALLESRASGQGQVVDAAMVDGTAQMMWMFQGWHAAGAFNDAERESNLLDGGAPFYDVYECADGRHVSLGAIEPQFYELLMRIAQLDREVFSDRSRSRWPELKLKMAEVFLSKTQAQWCELMEGTDVCFAPVLTLTEAATYPANVARSTYIEVDGFTQAAPAPRFSRTPSEVRHGARKLGADTETVLQSIGLMESAHDPVAAGAG
ncbi:MAG: Carnitine dehydratase [Hydrocarboniphaga sp.]|uniref:CaiB/BaiF CoA transferase family protein n=1 Tax=Hydrocarboniphaga sp. TaxID=2033016 RepID=UPI002616FE77|nr:CaiB/BaiF CoA-transferase family protein [Hydrocarboniphaga sp.]MDB5969178.1 Carnitine dehydratase [Hydrocarboniphaga sp.]